MTSFEPSTHRADVVEHDLEVLPDDEDVSCCVVCGAAVAQAGCCSFPCVSEARRELDQNLARLRALQAHDGPTGTRARLTERNGQLTAALLGWRQ